MSHACLLKHYRDRGGYEFYITGGGLSLPVGLLGALGGGDGGVAHAGALGDGSALGGAEGHAAHTQAWYEFRSVPSLFGTNPHMTRTA